MTKLIQKNVCGLLMASAILVSANAYADDRSYEVSITNLTRGQTFTPILIASHKKGPSLFTLGAQASSELATIAESGNPAPLTTALQATGKTTEVKNSGALLAPGATVTMTINTEGAKYLSMASMLIPTNDAFVALNGIRLPKKASSHLAIAYDAGSEPNDELCASIPGPVCGGEGASPDAGGEGYVHIHAGIHGAGQDVNVLNASERDWRNPVALIKIKRIDD